MIIKQTSYNPFVIFPQGFVNIFPDASLFVQANHIFYSVIPNEREESYKQDFSLRPK